MLPGGVPFRTRRAIRTLPPCPEAQDSTLVSRYCIFLAVMQGKGGSPMLRRLALASLASFVLLTPALVTAQTAAFRIEEATIEDIQGAIMRGELTSTRLVQLYLNRIKAY